MKIFSKVLIVALLASAFGSTLSAKTVTIMNGCGFTLNFIGLSRGSETEVENLLDSALAAGEGIQVELNETKNIDLTVQDNEGTQVDFSGLNLGSASKITLRADGTADIE